MPTLLVAAAVAAMIGLGIWQLQRMGEKRALLERYERAAGLPTMSFPDVPVKPDALYFRRATGFCLEPVSMQPRAGRNLKDEPGYSHIYRCRTGYEGPGMSVNAGWAKSAQPARWKGGEVSGVIAPAGKGGVSLVADRPLAGLEPSQPPGPATIPNNHFIYALQWFFFAAAAVVIYLLALRARAKKEGA